MKKLKLDSLKLNPPEILTRVQLKNVMGGDGSGGSEDCTNSCSGYSGFATTSHSCDPCGLDITKSTSDTSDSCCF